MVHARAVAASPEELDAWIARTDDLRDRLEKGGYGSDFAADDLFPLFQSYVAKATAAAASRAPSGAIPPSWGRTGVVIVAIAVAVGVIVAVMLLS
jgi:hypothetical protein